MSNTEISGLDLEFEFSLKPSIIDGFSHFLIDFKGKAINWDDGEDVEVASLSGQRLDIATANNEYNSLQELMDCISPEISDLGHHIIDNNICYIECCNEAEKSKTQCKSLVYISSLVVESAYRHHHIGVEMMRRLSETIDMNQSLVALKAFPILDDDSHDRNQELKRSLKLFYSKLGFRHSGEHFMVKNAKECYAQKARKSL